MAVIDARRFRNRIGDGMDTEQAVDAADDAAERTADHRANRSGIVGAFVKAVRNTIRHALRVRGHRRSDGRGNGRSEHNLYSHANFLSVCLEESRDVPANDGDSAAWAWRRRAAAPIARGVRQNDHTGRPRV